LKLVFSCPVGPVRMVDLPGPPLGHPRPRVAEQEFKLATSPLLLPWLLEEKRAFEAKKENAEKPVPDKILQPMVDLYLF